MRTENRLILLFKGDAEEQPTHGDIWVLIFIAEMIFLEWSRTRLSH